MGHSQLRNFLFIQAIAAHIGVLLSADSVSIGFQKNKCYGQVQIGSKDSETFEDDRWDFNNSKVLCRNSSCGTALKSLNASTSKIPDFLCTGNEKSFKECQRKNNNTQNASAIKAVVVCSDALSKPRISLTLPNGTSINSSYAEIPRGSGFFIDCAVDSMPNVSKRFFLYYNGNSTNTTKLESDRSGSFNISVADYNNEGNYSCMYAVDLNGRYKSDESGWIHVVVRDPWWKLLLYIVPAGVLVLLLMVLLVACLVCRRRKRAEKPSDVVLNQVTVRNSYIDDEEERDYVNMEPANTNNLGTEKMDEKDSDSSDYEDPEQDKNDSSDDENDYVNPNEGPVSARVFTKAQREEEDSSDDEHDYVNPNEGPVSARVCSNRTVAATRVPHAQDQREEEDSSDDEHDYVDPNEGPVSARVFTKAQREEEDSSDDEHDYVNPNEGSVSARVFTKAQHEEEDSSDDEHDYVDPNEGPVSARVCSNRTVAATRVPHAQDQREEEDSSDGEDYVNLMEQIVDICGEKLDIYQNL